MQYDFYTKDFFPTRKPRFLRKRKTFILSLILGFFVFVGIHISAPKNFPSGEVITLEKGVTLSEIALRFQEKSLIKSPGIFKTFVIAFGGEKTISFGDYLFEKPLNAFEIAKRMAIGKFGINKIAVTLPEGLSNKEMANILASKLKNFDKQIFLSATREGYSFSDTYYFFSTATASDVIRMMQENFNKKVNQQILDDIVKSGHSLEEIIIMASIVQNEAYNNYEEMQTIAGILWKRIAKKMRLQADATLVYANGGNARITTKDLQTDGPYNTYTRYGLPPTPIGNPGLGAIKASVYDKTSPYFFYLHDRDGLVHYAITFDDHKKNRALYLK
jgi:UPF0755 protein